jgi:hypothetical protein
MRPAANHPIWTQIATGKRPVHTEKLAINLFAKNNAMSLAKDSSPANVQQLAARTHEFFVKYEKISASEFDKILA